MSSSAPLRDRGAGVFKPAIRRASAWAFLGAVAILAGCASEPAPPAIARTGDPLVDLTTERDQIVPPKNRVLWDYRIATLALRQNAFAEAKSALDDAIRVMGGLMSGPDDAARRAHSLFVAEKEKPFVGEPYERAMAYYYRGILYWRDGEPDNARACFRSAELADAYADDTTYRADWVVPDYLDGFASAKLAADGSDALARAEKSAGKKLPPYDKNANVLVFCEYDTGPQKYQGGENGEQLRFQVYPARTRGAILTVGNRVARLMPWDDTAFQATTRGGRTMDYILGRKVVFKQGADTIGNLALTGAAIALAQDQQRMEEGKKPIHESAELALAGIGILSKVVAAATQTEADIRGWSDLPRYLSVASFRLAPGDYPATLEFLDDKMATSSTRTQHLTLHVEGDGRDTVVFLSEFSKKTALR